MLNNLPEGCDRQKIFKKARNMRYRILQMKKRKKYPKRPPMGFWEDLEKLIVGNSWKPIGDYFEKDL
jgi:hypothetical protein